MTRLAWLSPVIFLAVMFGGVGIAQLTGDWVTSGRQPIVAQQLAVDDIKGWMTLQQAADGLGVTVDDLVTLIGAPDPSLLTPGTAFKDVESVVPGFSLTTFRESVRALLAGRGVTTTPAPEPTKTGTRAQPR
ncbi:MAG TPA: hypothetical protein VLS51_05720 [Propionibacteriaceae bacterium]|nr:hypothetical protein [Propionibacteriaceae bacterium]